MECSFLPFIEINLDWLKLMKTFHDEWQTTYIGMHDIYEIGAPREFEFIINELRKDQFGLLVAEELYNGAPPWG